MLDRLVAERGSTPAFVRCDNGPEMTANALRDWCRFSGAGSAYIEPGSPWQNPYVESFGGRVRDELLAVELFSCLAEAQVLLEDWRQDYNHHRPHSSLGMMTPVAFAANLRQPLPRPTATAAEEEVDRGGRLTSTTPPATCAVFPNRADGRILLKDITAPASQANSHSSYRGATTTPTQLSQRVDR